MSPAGGSRDERDTRTGGAIDRNPNVEPGYAKESLGA
jgi:hypothetical protein